MLLFFLITLICAVTAAIASFNQHHIGVGITCSIVAGMIIVFLFYVRYLAGL